MKFKLLLSFAFITAAIAIGVIPSKKDKEPKERRFEKEKETRSLALEALEFMNTSEAFPNKNIPADAYAKAISWYQTNSAKDRAMNTSTSWISLGPTNMGGRTIAIAMDPTDTATLWMGSASGGLWKSTTGGIGNAAWNYVPLGFPVLGIASITINPLNHNEIYVGSGEVYSDSSYSQGLLNVRATRGSYGMGLFKTMDGGKTWTQSINWTYQQNRGIWKIVINPLDTLVVYAATTNGVYRSNNGGGTWTQVLNVPMAMDLQIHAVDTNILICGVGNYGSVLHGVYRTANGGATWTNISSGLPLPPYNGRVNLMVNAHNNDSMYAHISDIYNSIGIYLSVDKGVNWSLLESTDITNYQGWYAKGMLLQNGNPSNMLAGGIDLWSSSDGGASFSDVSQYSYVFHTDIHDIMGNPKDPNKIYIITDGGLFRSNDFGNTYYQCDGGYNTTQSYIGSISSTDTTVMLSGLQDNYTIKYFGNQTWYGVVGGDGCYNAIDHTNDNIEYGAYQYLNVFQCTDQGLFNAYSQILTNTANASGPNYAPFLAPYILCYSNTNYIYAGGQALQLSTDAGTTWNYMGNNPVNNGAYIMTIAASYTNTDSIYFATASDSSNVTKVFFSANQGTTLTDITAGLPNRYPRRIAVNPQNSKEVYIVFSGFGGKHVFKSTNAGASWTDISTTLPDMPFECITVDPLYPSYIYAGCDFGAFYSPDKGTTWFTYDMGFPDATMVFDLLVSPSDRYLYAFTHGRGIFKRSLSDIKPNSVNNISTANASVKVYPNPATDEIHVTMTGAASDKYIVNIYDMQGKQVRTAGFEGTTTVIPVSDLATGMYTLAVLKNGAACKYQKFIKE
jgi:photosystem II stability/assembly factor-like uncharacterized protein